MTLTDPHIGTTIAERFRISRLVGEDPAGRRYVARDCKTRKQVRVLLIHASVLEQHEEALRASGKALLALRHPNAVPLLAHGTQDGVGYRVSEWLRGSTLLEALEEGLPLQSTAVSWMLDVANALHAAHQLGFVHQGLSPTSIHLVRRSDPPDQAMLHDWGLAPLLEGADPGSSTGLLAVGGAAWMAPEYVRGEAFDVRSEVYALGALLFHCVVGHPPYTGPSMKVMASHIHAPVPAPSQHASGVPHWLDDLVLSMLDKAPENRPQTAEDVAKRLTEGAALLMDGAAHPERITATVPPKRLPQVEIRGAGSTRLPDAVADRRVAAPSPGPLAAAAALLFLLGLCTFGTVLFFFLWGSIS